MDRRRFLLTTGSSATILVAGCSSGQSGAIVSGSTDFERTWEKEIDGGLQLELKVTLSDGIWASGNVARSDNADDIATAETEEPETVTTRFQTPETMEYFISLQVEGAETRTGQASLTIAEAE